MSEYPEIAKESWYEKLDDWCDRHQEVIIIYIMFMMSLTIALLWLGSMNVL